MRRAFHLSTVVALMLLIGACGDPQTTEIRVSAASSLTVAFGEIEELFEAQHPEIDVILNLGASSHLREQIRAGAPADVFASADERNMAVLVEEGRIEGEPRVFALNSMKIAVPAGNPGAVAGLDDFARTDLLLGVCAEGVPCGDLARAALAAADVDLARHSSEPSVRSLLTKTAAGELDAGIVYVTDVAASGDVEGLPIPEDVNQVTGYPIAVVSGSADGGYGGLFIEFVISDAGQEVLAKYGFGRP